MLYLKKPNDAPIAEAQTMATTLCPLKKDIIPQARKAGIPTEPLPDGTPNLMNTMIKNVVCEVYRAMKEDTNVQIAVAPGAINVLATGGSPSGPVTVTGTNVGFGKGVGLIQ